MFLFNRHFEKLFRGFLLICLLNALTVEGRIPETETGYQCRKIWNTRSKSSTYPKSLLFCCHG